MATAEEIQALRELAPNGDGMDADHLGLLFDTFGLNLALAKLWATQEAKTANLVNVSESGSSRQMSQIHDHAGKMASKYLGLSEAETPSATSQPRSTTRRITR